MHPVSSELQLLLACSRVVAAPEDEAAIREILDNEIDWIRFARKGTEHRLAALAGHTLARAAPELVPEDILDACRITIDRTRTLNRTLFDELVRLNEVLLRNGVETIPFEGPILAIQAFGDLGLRMCRGLDLLVRDPDAAAARRLADVSEAGGIGINVRTRLAPVEMVLDIDHAEVWRRARCAELNGHMLITLAPEDHLLALVTHGNQELWRRIQLASDVAALIGSHPQLDWTGMLTRSRAEGYLRMLLLAALLAWEYFGAELPDTVIAAASADTAIASMMGSVVAHWQADTAAHAAGAFSLDVLRLHNGTRRRARYLARSVLWRRRAIPVSLASGLRALPSKIGRNLIFPAYRHVRAQMKRQSETVGATGRIIQPLNPPAHPHDAETWTLHARALSRSKRFAEAVEASDKALKHEPRNAAATLSGIESRLSSCDWRRREEDERWVGDCLRTQPQILEKVLGSFIQSFGFGNLEVRSLNLARRWALPEPLWRGESYRHDKIRIAYISTDFQDPMGYLAVGVFEHHDKERFETMAISLGPHKRSTLRNRIEAAFDRCVDATNMKDADIAAMLRDSEVDIAIDLYVASRYTQIFSARPAPVQVTYPGYPGTLGVPYIDYIIADRIVIPEEHRIYYREKVVYLPHSYLPSDKKRRFAEEPPSRGAAGLPETGFVFASFNNAYKITPEIFGIWMRLLHHVEGSVLWLVGDDSSTMLNLRREAKSRGIDAARLVFAERKPPAQHLARHRLAHLFLDTYPINAGATASEALWAGLPVLTCRGDIFFGRIATSLLQALGLPDLVTNSLAEYEQLARTLAHEPSRLAAIRAKLLRNHDTTPLFDTARYTRHLEAAFTVMWQRSEVNLPPIDFAVDPTLS
jgi:protein O-GlcNAc transferase